MQQSSYNKTSLSKFESMLKTNNILFFDSSEFEGIIQYYFEEGRQSLANKAIKLALEQHPSSVNLILLKAEALIYEDKLEEAERILNQVQAIEPNNEEIYINKASIASKRNDHTGAIEFLKIALIHAKFDADISAMLGMEYLYVDDFVQARNSFIKCIEDDNEDYSSLYNVIYCFDMEGKHEEAIDYLKDFVENDPYSEIAWHQLGRQYFILNKFEEALFAFDYAVIIDEFFVGGYLEKAKTLENLGKHAEAIENYLITIELDDPTAFAYFRIGECYNKLKNKDQALQYFKKTVKEDPLLDKGWLALTNLYFEDENFHKALYYINKALSIDESNTAYWRKYAETNLKLGFYEEVISAFYKCLDYNDETLEIYMGLADVLNFIGEFDDAVKILVKAKRIFSNNLEIDYRLGCLYFILGDDANGEKYLKKGFIEDFDYYHNFKDIFPAVFDLDIVRNIISEFKN